MKKVGLIFLMAVSGCYNPNPDKVQQNSIGEKKMIANSKEPGLKLFKLVDADYGVVLFLKNSALGRTGGPAFSAQKVFVSKIMPEQGTVLIYSGSLGGYILDIFRHVDLESRTATYYTQFSPPVTVKLD